MFPSILTILFPLFLAHATQSLPANNQLYDVPKAYEVYAAILPPEWSWKDAKAEHLVIQETTANYSMCLRPDADSAKLIGSAIADYVVRNEHTWLLQSRIKIEKPYSLLSQQKYRFGISPEPWRVGGVLRGLPKFGRHY